MRILKIIGFIILSISGTVTAQDGFVLYQMHRSVPQAISMNPAFIPESKIQIGIPLLSHHHVFAKNPFSLSDIVSRDDQDSMIIDTDKLFSHLDRTNRLSLKTSSTLLFTGFHLLKGFFTFSFDIHNDMKFSYPKEWMELFIKGNGHPEVIGERIPFNRIAFSFNSYSKTSISYGRPFMNDKLNLGIRASLLKGFFNAEIDRRIDGYFRTDPETYEFEIRMEDIQFNSSGFGLQDDDFAISERLFKNNYGMSFDVGALWKPLRNHTISMSVIDMGFINWNYDVKNYRIEDGVYTFNGIDFEDAGSFGDVLDSLSDIFNPVELSESYHTNLDPRLYVGYKYNFRKIHSFYFLHQSLLFRNDYSYGLSLGYGIRPAKIIQANIAYSFINQHPANLGFGFSFNPGTVNLYVISDNICSFFKPEAASLADLRFGLNLIFK